MPIRAELRDVTGSRGENIAEICLTDISEFQSPLFAMSFLGDKWPTVDYYVELLGVKNMRPFFLIQVKTTRAAIARRYLKIQLSLRDITRLLGLPGPTYLLGVHEPSRRVFVKSVHDGVRQKAITRIPLEHELTPKNLRRLHEEVEKYWARRPYKPLASVFE